MKKQANALFSLAGLLLTFSSGCSSIVKKPEIHQIKKIAILSITAPQKVPHKNGKGEVSGWSSSNRLAIADQALEAYSTEFKKLGWQIIPTSQISKLSAFQENFAPKISKADNGVAKALNTMNAMSVENTYFSPSHLYPINWSEDNGSGGTLTLDIANLSLEKSKKLKTKMQEVATQAGADAAVLIQADYCYEDGMFSLGQAGSGTGTAVLSGASAIYAITPKGDEVIKMKRITTPCGGDNRVKSDSSTAMVKNFLLFSSENIQRMFQEVNNKSAAENVGKIQKAMKD